MRATLPLALALALSLPAPAHAGETGNATLRKTGDALQYALPLLAGICAIKQHRTAEYVTGFVVNAAIVQGFKAGLGTAAINIRPDGSGHGFPSGHTASAMYGATNLAKKCFPDRPGLRTLVYGAALLTGLSRLDSDHHTAAQVGAGLVVGYFSNGITLNAGPGRLGLGYSMQF